MSRAILTVLVAILSIQLVRSRSLRDDSNLVSDGMSLQNQFGVLQLGHHHHLGASTVTCQPVYDFLPCATHVQGEIFLIVVYQLFLSLAEKYIATGSNLFFEMFGTGIFGACLFQILGLFPQVILVLVSAGAAPAEAVEGMVEMGMAILVGSVTMNLTIVWGLIVAFGSYTLSTNSNSSNQENPSSFCITGYGVETDELTKVTARIMLLSMIPFILLQMQVFLISSFAKRAVILISLIISIIYLITYCTYQVFQPWIQNRRLEYLMSIYVKDPLLQCISGQDGKPDESKICELFRKIDLNNDSRISAAEVRAMMIGLHMGEVRSHEDDFVNKLMEDFDVDNDSGIDENEFTQGVSKWVSKGKDCSGNQRQKKKKSSDRNSQSNGITEEQQSLVPSTTTTSTKSSPNKPACWNYAKAAFLILLGTVMAFVLAAPLMISIQDLASSIKVPPFFITYFVIPLALSSRMGYRAVISVRKRTQDAASLALSMIYGGMFMNNVMSLVILLALVYIKNLAWNFSAEVLTVLTICSGMGFAASFSSKFPFWTCIIAFALYPISLAFIYASF